MPTESIPPTLEPTPADEGRNRHGQPQARARLRLLDLEELLATRLLVQGNSGSGKSHLLRRLLEQSANWVQQCVIDPEGDFVTLADAFGHVVVDADRSENELTRIAGRIRQHRVSVVLNLEGLDAEQQMRCAAAFLGGLFDADRDYWYPMLVVVDEAQLFAPAAGGEVSDEARKLSLGAMTNLMCRGRKRGLAGVIATQRLAKLAKNVAAEASNFLMGRTFLDIDMARAADLLGMDRRTAEMFRDLERGHFVALGPSMSRRPLPIRIGTVETSARSTSPKLMPLPDKTPEDAAELIFTPDPQEDDPAAAQARTARTAPHRRYTGAVRARPAPEPEPAPTLFPEVDAAERETLLTEILARSRCGSRCGLSLGGGALSGFSRAVPDPPRARRTPLELPGFRRRLAVARAGVDTETAESEAWQQALALSRSLRDDVQGVFLIVARAAHDGLPCPSDATLARAYGSHSAGRARRLLTYFEERELIVLRTDQSGNRIAAFPHLGTETAPGNPDAPAHDASQQAAE